MEFGNWFKRQDGKTPKYFCTNCFTLFRTGRFERRDLMLYDDICPSCGAPAYDIKRDKDEIKKELEERMEEKK